MSYSEQLVQVAGVVPEKLAAAALLVLYRFLYEEAEDEQFCNALYERYLADPDKGEGVPIEEVAARLGVVLE